MSFEEGVLPVKYLGVPLISSRLYYKDCKVLVDRMEARITDWKNKSLSFAGRLQLIRSVLSSLHVYWASVFILPKRIINDLEERMRRFLWAQGNGIKGKAKVNWKMVCLPRTEGGLGIRRIGDMNKALMVAHIWSLLSNRESLWVKWIHAYRIRERNFWDVPVKNNITWSWRKMLGLRQSIRNNIWVNIRDGVNTSVWFDKWEAMCPLADVCINGEWVWPEAWFTRFPGLIDLQVPELNANDHDRLVWCTNGGRKTEFSTSTTWDDLRHSHNEVQWASIVWFPQAIPRHSFLLWLLVLRKLKTHDVMSRWNSGNMNLNLLCCSLCSRGPDSHEHLFFECDEAKNIWYGVRGRAGMGAIQNSWNDIFEYLLSIANSKKAANVIAKLVVGATVYFVWEERNRRLFTPKRRTREQLIGVVLSTVRMKLHTMRFRYSVHMERVLQEWSLPRGLLVADDDCG
ncbi:putative reverse transcriptase zinc-binding domain-containing protein [Helianthus annuus]|nr:putative reverse transcriptase zinc-binding domain-containing protein [Helianthus annuus]